MRILFTSCPAVGHVLPLLPLARAAHDAGHDVRVGTGRGVLGLAEAAGLRTVALGRPDLPTAIREHPEIGRYTGRARAVQMMRLVFSGPLAAAVAGDTLRLAETWRPDLVVAEDMEMGGGLAAEALGVPHVVVQVTAWRPAKLRIAAEPLNERRAELGLPPDPALERFHGALFLATRPPSLRDPEAPLPARTSELRPAPEDAGGPGDTPWPADRRRHRVAVTLGTVNSDRHELLRVILDGLAGLDADVLVALGADPAELGGVPVNADVRRWTPMGALVAGADAIVFHGGSGTMMTALAAGLPLVVVPIAADQPDNADRCAAAGVARVVAPGEMDAGRVRKAVEAVLTEPAWRARAAAVAAEIAAMPAPADVVRRLESLVDDRAPSGRTTTIARSP